MSSAISHCAITRGLFFVLELLALQCDHGIGGLTPGPGGGEDGASGALIVGNHGGLDGMGRIERLEVVLEREDVGLFISGEALFLGKAEVEVAVLLFEQVLTLPGRFLIAAGSVL